MTKIQTPIEHPLLLPATQHQRNQDIRDWAEGIDDLQSDATF